MPCWPATSGRSRSGRFRRCFEAVTCSCWSNPSFHSLDSDHQSQLWWCCTEKAPKRGKVLPVPIEFVVKGKPSSVNSTSAKKTAWKLNVRSEANAALLAKYPVPPVPSPYAGDLTAKVFFFPHNNQYLDVDNGIKHTLDAMAPPIIANDRSVQRLIAERISAVPGASVVVPVALAPTLLAAFNIASGAGGGSKTQATAIKVEPYAANNGAMW